jgi:hypothetical protein
VLAALLAMALASAAAPAPLFRAAAPASGGSAPRASESAGRTAARASGFPAPPASGRSAARLRLAAAVPQKAITCPRSALLTLARIGPGQLLLLSCGDGRRFLQVRVQGRPLAAMPLAELWPEGEWEFRDSPRLAVRAGTRSLVPLLIARREPAAEALAVVAADFEVNTLSVAYRSPATTALTYALRDLDGDGVPELRLGLDDGKRREVRTVTLAVPAGEWHGALAEPLGPAAKALCPAADCDPVLDFDLEARKLRDATYLFARGRDRLCGSGGCALVIVRVAKGEGREVLRDFGLWTIGPALPGRPPCVVIRNRAEPPQKRCWRGKDYGE